MVSVDGGVKRTGYQQCEEGMSDWKAETGKLDGPSGAVSNNPCILLGPIHLHAASSIDTPFTDKHHFHKLSFILTYW